MQIEGKNKERLINKFDEPLDESTVGSAVIES